MTAGALSPIDELFRQNKLVSNLHTMYNELVVVWVCLVYLLEIVPHYTFGSHYHEVSKRSMVKVSVMRMRRALQTTCAISECGVSIRIPTQLIGYPVDACIRFSQGGSPLERRMEGYINENPCHGGDNQRSANQSCSHKSIKTSNSTESAVSSSTEFHK